MQNKPTHAQDPHDSDFLTWTLAAAAVLIMAVAVRINSNEPSAPRPAAHAPGGQGREPERVDQAAHAESDA